MKRAISAIAYVGNDADLPRITELLRGQANKKAHKENTVIAGPGLLAFSHTADDGRDVWIGTWEIEATHE